MADVIDEIDEIDVTIPNRRTPNNRTGAFALFGSVRSCSVLFVRSIAKCGKIFAFRKKLLPLYDY